MADEEQDYKKLLKAIKDVADASSARFEKEKAQAAEIKRLYDQRIGAEKNLKEIVAQNNTILEAEAKIARARFEEGIRFLTEFADKEKELVDLRTAAMLAEASSTGTERENFKAQAEALDKEIDKLRKRNGLLKQNIGNLQESADKTTEIDDANKGLQSSLRNVLKTTTGLTGETGGFLANLQHISNPKIKANLVNTFKATVNPLAIAGNLLSKITQSTLHFMKEFDKLAADFRKNTGIIDRGFGGIEQRIVNVQRANLRMGVSMDEAFQAANSLTAEMASFTSMTDDAQKTVLSAATILQEFGVGAQTTAQIFNNFSKGLGYNADQLEKLSTQLMGISTSLKIPPQIIATEFNAASKELMKYGDDMVGVFEGIAEQSKQTGIAMGELLGIVKQFDTFEGAGAAVGKLNAILGGPYLNAINMVYATEEERIKQLRQSIQLSGRQFNQLSRFEQQAIATAAGISDMTVAARLFGGTNSEFAKTQMSMKEMQERAAKAQAVQEKFTQVMQSFAIALGPVVHVLGLLADMLLFVINPFGELARMLGADEGLISYMGSFTVAGYAVAVMIMKGWIPALAGLNIGIIKLKMTTFQLVGALMGAVAIGTFMYDWVSGMSTAVAALTTILVAGALAWAAYLTAASGGVAAIPIALGLAAVGAAVGGIAGTIETFSTGKSRGQSVGGGAALVGEKGQEMVVTEDGSRYMVNSPSVMALDKNDTVYTNAETKAMMNGGGSRDNSAELAAIRQQQQDAAQDRALIQQTLDAVMTVASRPIELDGKKVFEGTKPQLNRALGLSRRGSIA
jgi:hypothetical protein